MFVHEARTFRNQARLAITLSWVAGYTNILTLLICGQATSHVTGTVSQVGRDVAEGTWGLAGYMVSLVGVFLLGAMVSGALTEWAHQRRRRSVYVLPMAVEALALALFALVVDFHAIGVLDAELGHEAALRWMTLLPSFAMGLQNATVSRISGGIVRTTHVSGVVTDLGLEGAVWALRRATGVREVAPRGGFASGWRLLLLASIAGSFALGAGLGTLARDASQRWSMVPPVAFLCWILVLDLWRPIAAPQSDRESGGDLHLALPASVGLYHLSLHRGRRPGRGRRGRFPALSTWGERLDPVVRVVVLDLTGVHELDEDGAGELRRLADRLRAQGRRLVLAGVSREGYGALTRSGTLRPEVDAHLCPDLELGAAHALTLLG